MSMSLSTGLGLTARRGGGAAAVPNLGTLVWAGVRILWDGDAIYWGTP